MMDAGSAHLASRVHRHVPPGLVAQVQVHHEAILRYNEVSHAHDHYK